MHQTTITNLQQTLNRLQPAPLICYSSTERDTLSILLTSTVQDLHMLYPNHLSSGQCHKLLQNLALLEQQRTRLANRPGSPSCAAWGAIHISLQAAIIDTLFS